MGRGDIEDVDVGVLDEIHVGAVGGAGGRFLDIAGDEFFGTGLGGAGSNSGDGVDDVGGATEGGVDEEVFGE